MAKRFLCVGEDYESNGEKKVAWKRVGEMFTSKAGKDYVKLYMHPGVLISVFEDKPKDQTGAISCGSTDKFGADMEVNF